MTGHFKAPMTPEEEKEIVDLLANEVLEVEKETNSKINQADIIDILIGTICKMKLNAEEWDYFRVLFRNELRDYLMRKEITSNGVKKMCELCHMTPCHPRCPNAPEPPKVYTCKYCGESIVEGDNYFELDGDQYHDECFADAAVGILTKSYGAKSAVAEVEG